MGALGAWVRSQAAGERIVHPKYLEASIVSDQLCALVRELLGQYGIMNAQFLTFDHRGVLLREANERNRGQEKDSKPQNHLPSGTVSRPLHSLSQSNHLTRRCRV